MLTFIKPFYGCRDGEVYPEHFQAGDACPPELEDAAIDCGVVEVDAPELGAETKKPRGKAKD